MSIRGWVYVITNRALPGLVKIGYSTKDPSLRADELNHTGCPTPYVVEYDVLVIDPREFEQKIHASLHEVIEGKEWFRCSLSHAIHAVKSVVGENIIIEKSGCSVESAATSQAPETQFSECFLCQKQGGHLFENKWYCLEHYNQQLIPEVPNNPIRKPVGLFR